jgi:hypothetical protein
MVDETIRETIGTALQRRIVLGIKPGATSIYFLSLESISTYSGGWTGGGGGGAWLGPSMRSRQLRPQRIVATTSTKPSHAMSAAMMFVEATPTAWMSGSTPADAAAEKR